MVQYTFGSPQTMSIQMCDMFAVTRGPALTPCSDLVSKLNNPGVHTQQD